MSAIQKQETTGAPKIGTAINETKAADKSLGQTARWLEDRIGSVPSIAMKVKPPVQELRLDEIPGDQIGANLGALDRENKTGKTWEITYL